MHTVLLVFKHTLLPISMWRPIICHRSASSRVACSSSHFLSSFLPLESSEVDLLVSSHTIQCQHYYTLETQLPPGALGLNAFIQPLKYQVSYVFPYPTLVPLVLSKFLAEHVTGQFTFDTGGTMLDGGSLTSHSSQHVGRPSLVLYCHKGSCHGCFSRPVAQGSAISAFNPLAA